MAVFKFVIGNKGKSYQVEKEQGDAPVLGKKIGDNISGDFLNLPGYELQITGGSDKDGFPMKKDVEGIMRRKIVITRGIGLRSKIGGLRRRRTLRGNAISPDVSQINCKVVKEGETPLEEILGKKKEEKKEEVKE
ncbi:MAG: 30S ribosomal protein S6e [Candidatus Aenigmarchaeota archaeon]|nr:30S ribosomal protein S6e [Candidatus Aenigmarchaeota archaeon]